MFTKKQLSFNPKHWAILFVIVAILCAVLSIMFNCHALYIVSLASVFATLSEALLVFSTLNIQRNVLEEEITKNELSRFDSRFYNILSSFRMDAMSIEIIADFIGTKEKNKGLESHQTFRGDGAFSIAKQIVEALNKGIMDESLREYDNEDLNIELHNIFMIEDNIFDSASDDMLNDLEVKKQKYIKGFQIPYLLYKYDINHEEKSTLASFESNKLKAIILNKLEKHQPSIFAKYIQTIRFLICIIEQLPCNIDKNKYYSHISCLLCKNEHDFLNLFKEFDKITCQ